MFPLLICIYLFFTKSFFKFIFFLHFFSRGIWKIEAELNIQPKIFLFSFFCVYFFFIFCFSFQYLSLDKSSFFVNINAKYIFFFFYTFGIFLFIFFFFLFCLPFFLVGSVFTFLP